MHRHPIIISTIAALSVAACDGSRASTMKTLAEVQAISAQKDSLLKDVTATTAFIAEVSRQINTVRNLKTGTNAANGTDLEDNLTPDQRRTRVLESVREITERLAMAENRLAQSRRRVTELTGSDAEKSARLAAFDSTVASFKDIMENQRSQMASLTEQVNALTTENTQLKTDVVQLASEKTTLTAEKDTLTSYKNTVYYIVADQKSLMERHVIEKSGGFLGFGKTPVAARMLNAADFVPIDKTKVNEIPLPNPEKAYRVITRQDLAALETPPGKGGRITGALRIRDAESFWAASKYLILVQQ